MIIKKIHIGFLLFIFSNGLISQNQHSIHEKDIVVFFKDFMVRPTKEKFQSSIPTLDDCKKVFVDPDYNIYHNKLKEKLNGEHWENDYLSGLHNKADSIEVYSFTKSDLLLKSDYYKGGNGMHWIENKFQNDIIIYGLVYKNENGHRITNTFLFNNGFEWKLLPKPWLYISVKNNELRKYTDTGWLEFLIPKFMKDITPYGDNFSPHYTMYNFISYDNKVSINILINNSTNSGKEFQFDLKTAYLSNLKREDLKINYKRFMEDKYFISGELLNESIIYEFSYTKKRYGYTYSIKYDKNYKQYFNQNLKYIINGFKILR